MYQRLRPTASIPLLLPFPSASRKVQIGKLAAKKRSRREWIVGNSVGRECRHIEMVLITIIFLFCGPSYNIKNEKQLFPLFSKTSVKLLMVVRYFYYKTWTWQRLSFVSQETLRLPKTRAPPKVRQRLLWISRINQYDMGSSGMSHKTSIIFSFLSDA